MRTTCLFVAIACVLASPIPLTASDQPSTVAPKTNWSRVLELKTGTEITIALRGSQPIKRSVVQADSSRLTVLNLSDPLRPRRITRVLLNLASAHPEAFAPPLGGTFVEGNIQVGVDGVFLDGRKIAELPDVAETIARDDILEISARRTGGGLLGHLGVLGGYFAGALTGGYVGALICRCDAGFLPGMVGGGISGGVMGYRASVREREHLIYRAP